MPCQLPPVAHYRIFNQNIKLNLPPSEFGGLAEVSSNILLVRRNLKKIALRNFINSKQSCIRDHGTQTICNQFGRKRDSRQRNGEVIFQKGQINFNIIHLTGGTLTTYFTRDKMHAIQVSPQHGGSLLVKFLFCKSIIVVVRKCGRSIV